MSLAAKLRRAPLRLTTGAFILNSGVGKWAGGEEQAKAIHGMAAGAYPALGKMQPPTFLRALSVAEIATGAVLLAPIVPAGIAGVALTAFAGGLIGLYLRTPALHEPGSVRPTQAGIAVAKDVWMAGAGAALVVDALTTRSDKKADVTD